MDRDHTACVCQSLGRHALNRPVQFTAECALHVPGSKQDARGCRYATITVFFVGTMSVLTLLVQGTTMPRLLKLLGVTKKTPIQIQHLLLAAKEIEDYADRNLSHLKARARTCALVCNSKYTPLMPHCGSWSIR